MRYALPETSRNATPRWRYQCHVPEWCCTRYSTTKNGVSPCRCLARSRVDRLDIVGVVARLVDPEATRLQRLARFHEGQLLRTRRQEQHVGGQVPVPHAFVGACHGELVSLFGAAQRFLRAFARGDVVGRAGQAQRLAVDIAKTLTARVDPAHLAAVAADDAELVVQPRRQPRQVFVAAAHHALFVIGMQRDRSRSTPGPPAPGRHRAGRRSRPAWPTRRSFPGRYPTTSGPRWSRSSASA